MTQGFVGGRGKKAPYITTHVRVPEPIKSHIESLISEYKNAVLDGTDQGFLDSLNQLERNKHIVDSEVCAPTLQTQLGSIKLQLAIARTNSKNTRNWVEANKLISVLEKLVD